MDQFALFSSLQRLELISSTQSLSEEQRMNLRTLYDELALQYPHSNAIQYIRLELLNDTEFRVACDRLVLKAIRKGIPSFFTSMKGLCKRQPSRVSE